MVVCHNSVHIVSAFSAGMCKLSIRHVLVRKSSYAPTASICLLHVSCFSVLTLPIVSASTVFNRGRGQGYSVSWDRDRHEPPLRHGESDRTTLCSRAMCRAVNRVIGCAMPARASTSRTALATPLTVATTSQHGTAHTRADPSRYSHCTSVSVAVCTLGTSRHHAATALWCSEKT
jgi:hypothetical protein